MLSKDTIYAVLPARDLGRARTFYHDALGLDPVEEHRGMLLYRTGAGSGFQLYETENAGSARNTQMGWVTDDLEEEMKSLRSHGVVFENYDMPGLKTENGVAHDEMGDAAWFRDSEGNILCLSQTPALA